MTDTTPAATAAPRPELSPEDLAELSYSSIDGGFDGYTVVRKEKIIGQRRWYTTFEWIILRHSDGTYWAVQQDRGSTEQQDSEDAEVVAQVMPIEKTITVYERLG